MMRTLGLLCLLLLCLPGCQDGKKEHKAQAALPIPAYADGPEGLMQLWRDILGAGQKDDRIRVHDLLASQALNRQDLAELFGPEQAGKLWPRYQIMFGSLANSGALEMVGQIYEKKLDDVAVIRVDQQAPAERQPTDQAVLSALVRPVPMYSVRLKRKAEQKGLRYDFFVYRDGHWRTGNFLGRELQQEAASTKNKGG